MIDFDFDISELDMTEYPYEGAFYRMEIDLSQPPVEQVEEEVMVFSTICDIQRSSRLHVGGLLAADYTIYWPLDPNSGATGTIDKFDDIPVRRGDTFRGMFYGYLVEGVVEIVRPSQLGGASCDIKVIKENGD